ncbi:hypothetical protein [Chlorogloeopsis sp. ULAP02]|uniref:hypothetical protein n=1 Tax=Chlorogloeopsis sp. ULAP02 TaxID=3107926 RepID=UPI003135DFA6
MKLSTHQSVVLCKADQTTLLPSWWNLHLWRLRLIGFYMAVASRVWGNPFWWVSRKNNLPNSIKQI